jgi:catechol 2,3-dioxygenase-like lactoylglutathione lyase family enzyme
MNMLSQTDVQVQRIRAIGLTVTSCDCSVDLYTQALGFELVSDITVEGEDYSDLQGITEAKIRIITLRLGDELIELMEYLNITGKPIPKDSQSNDIWFQHLAIVVSDMDRAYAQVCSFSIEPISVAPQTILSDDETSGGVRAFKFKDPDGHDLELIWFPADKINGIRTQIAYFWESTIVRSLFPTLRRVYTFTATSWECKLIAAVSTGVQLNLA